MRRALQIVPDETSARTERLEFLGVMSEVKIPDAVPALVKACLAAVKDDGLEKAILSAMQNYDDPAIAEAVLKVYPVLGRESIRGREARRTQPLEPHVVLDPGRVARLARRQAAGGGA